MKILLGNNTLSIFAGSETACYTMAIELKRRGHKITAFSLNLGELGKKMEKEGMLTLGRNKINLR
jgi:hypothetical protein